MMNHHVKRLVNQWKAEYAKQKECDISNSVSQNFRIIAGIAGFHSVCSQQIIRCNNVANIIFV